ncbi:methylenetetrahydrofolate reductase C-terminal domain-containing protein [Nonomuraea sp. B1E8]|uniref:methylenetetrahydrofolate reductase C-terminal domain-containing protein n=1 Tax=unclassified Nonomuraea TaxID=2593643 RepID=UPI00325C57A6
MPGACGQCALPDTGYTCPKQLRNGPCGGVAADGRCEVHPDLVCVWVTAIERAQGAGHGADLDLLQRPVDHREWGQALLSRPRAASRPEAPLLTPLGVVGDASPAGCLRPR